MRARLGRDAGASGARHVRTRERVRQGAVGHGSSRGSGARFVDKPTIHVLHGGGDVALDCDFKIWGLCSL